MKHTTRKTLGLVSACALVIAILAIGDDAQAIIDGTPDGSGHPYVGAVDVTPTGRRIPASGVLVSPTVFITAGHVGNFFTDAGLTTARVSFDPVLDQVSATFYEGTIHLNPHFTGRYNDPSDIAVIVFSQPIPGITPARLPTQRHLDALNPQQLRSTTDSAVGYGISRVSGGDDGGGSPGIDRSSGGTRRVGAWSLLSLSPDWIRFDMGEQQGCVGDSGAPSFLGTSNLVIGIHIGGDSACEHMGSDVRVDTPAIRSFLAPFVALP